MFKKISVKDWIEVEDNPIQRDTEKHAAKAKHLLTPHASHQFVFAAQLPSGKLVKLDGHTRALMWRRKEVVAPPEVFVAVIPVKDRAEAEALYKDFDSKDALETIRDKVSGAFNRHNFEPRSTFLQAGNLQYALRIATGILMGGAASLGSGGQGKKVGTLTRILLETDVYSMINEFSYELHALDGFMLRSGAFPAGIIAAFMVSVRRHGHKVIPFWQGVFSNAGSKHGSQMDAIQATCELISRRRGHGGAAVAADLCSRALGGVEKWMEDAVMTRVPGPIDTADYLKGHEKPSERLIKARDIKAKAA